MTGKELRRPRYYYTWKRTKVGMWWRMQAVSEREERKDIVNEQRHIAPTNESRVPLRPKSFASAVHSACRPSAPTKRTRCAFERGTRYSDDRYF